MVAAWVASPFIFQLPAISWRMAVLAALSPGGIANPAAADQSHAKVMPDRGQSAPAVCAKFHVTPETFRLLLQSGWGERAPA
jgi:hypothetical protein